MFWYPSVRRLGSQRRPPHAEASVRLARAWRTHRTPYRQEIYTNIIALLAVTRKFDSESEVYRWVKSGVHDSTHGDLLAEFALPLVNQVAPEKIGRRMLGLRAIADTTV
jgi:hypothetical protein